LAPARQKRGPTMGPLAVLDVELGQRFRRVASRRETIETGGGVGREDDRTVRAPDAAAIEVRIGEIDRPPAVDRDLAELARREIADPFSVGREERAARARRSVERARL